MPKAEWGTKRVCPTTGRRFYDLGRTPIVSPYTGEVVTLETGRTSRVLVSERAAKAAKPELLEDEDDLVLDDEEAADVDLGDDILDDEDEDDDVSLDDLADVAGDEEDV
ncbi:MAG: TIGR02300 family protein [Rhodobacteraceae bacterium]|jgi:uncharacterized protein (TIGR02300 family)|nr:TIGR02300 family protein [Paracoccaceae bacterium]